MENNRCWFETSIIADASSVLTNEPSKQSSTVNQETDCAEYFPFLVMGNGASSEEKYAVSRSRDIDAMLEREKKMLRGVMKLLLLGPGEVGKSTIVKQMRIIHDAGFSKEECEASTSIIFTITIKLILAIARAFLSSGQWRFSDPESASAVIILNEAVEFNNIIMVLTDDLVAAMKQLWADQALMSFFVSHFQHKSDDGNFHFLRNLDRVLSPGYSPTEEDLLNLRVPTTGIVELSFAIKDLTLRVTDVGGQKALRRKWIHAFEGVNGLIFMAALSDYNIGMRENPRMNRMRDALQLFDDIGNSVWFRRSCIILFLNKKDLFASKLRRTPLRKCFTGYTGDNSFDNAARYVEKRFLHVIADKAKEIYTHVTCATDTNQIQLVLESCIKTIRSKNIATAALN